MVGVSICLFLCPGLRGMIRASETSSKKPTFSNHLTEETLMNAYESAVVGKLGAIAEELKNQNKMLQTLIDLLPAQLPPSDKSVQPESLDGQPAQAPDLKA